MTKPPALAPLSLRWRLPLRHVPWILGLVLLVVLLEVVVQSRWVVPWVIG